MKTSASRSAATPRASSVHWDKVFDVTPGRPTAAVLAPGDTVRIAQSLAYEAAIAQASGAVALTRDLHARQLWIACSST
ncbi:hypothetical protein BH11GEM2_BH11GEM2_07260 [soil metagenome]